MLLPHIISFAASFPLLRWLAAFIQWVRNFGVAGSLLYGAVYVIAAVLFVPASPMTAAAGFIYGPLLGTLIVSPASVLGATLAFLISRHLARDWAAAKMEKYPQFPVIDRAIEKNGFKVVLLLRLQLVIPYNLLNYALGLTRIRLRDFLIATWIGMLPATFLYVYLGSVAQNVSDLLGGRLPHSALRTALFWSGLAATILFAWYIGRVSRRALQQELGPPTPNSQRATR